METIKDFEHPVAENRRWGIFSDPDHPSVNMGLFFSQDIHLPTVNGTRLTADQFLHYIRMNINSFVNTNISEFVPYTYSTNNDTNLWNSSNPTGAIISIAIPGNYGSVVTSFSSNNK